MNNSILLKIKKNKLFLLLFIVFIFSYKTSHADDVFRVTEYNITSGFNSTTYNLNLANALSPDHFILIRGAESGNVVKAPQNSYVKISKLPSGANKSLPTTGSPTLLELKRYAAGSSSWVGVVTIVECLADCENNGFKTLDIKDFSTPNYTSTTTRLQSGNLTSSTSWTDLNKVTIFGGGLGSGSNIESTSSLSGHFNSGWLRLYPTLDNTINWERYNSSTDNILHTASHTAYIIQWGNLWNIQRTMISGSNGGSGANATGEYNTSSIFSVTRANTWIYGSGYSQASTMGRGSMGTIITLGNGVAKNTSENLVAMGSQVSGATKMFDIYVMSHPNLSVDYRFKTSSTTATVTTNTNSNTSNRMSLAYSSMTSVTNNYPAIIFSSRYSSNTVITLKREYSPIGTQYNFASWVQGINWKNIQYTPQPTLSQYKYRWRDDTKSLNENNGWLAEYNQNPQLILKNINYRIRFSVVNTGENDTTPGRNFRIQYGYKVGNSCDNTTSWYNLTDDPNVIMSDSSWYADQDSTAMLFDNPEGYIFIQGKGMDTSNTSNPVALLNNRYTELEYSIKLSNNLVDGKYCLRLFNSTDNKPINNYLSYPEMLVGSYLVQDYYRWYENNNLITPTIALANENSEVFIKEKEISRLRLNIEAKNTAFGPNNLVLQYSKNTTNGPWKTVSNPILSAKWWDNNYFKRSKISFGTNHSLLPIGYTATFSMDTRVAQSDGDDIRIVFQNNNGEIIELDRIANTWNSATSSIQFKLVSEIPANSNLSSNGDYYIYYDNSLAKNPPSELSNIYSVYDDFSNEQIRSDWKTFDNDKVNGTSFTESSNTLNINAGGVDTWESGTNMVDDYSTVYQENISGDFEVTVKCIYQDNIGTAQNTGIMIKNDITKTQANNGYFVNVDNISAAYISAWDSNYNGYLDTLFASSTGVSWPHCLRITKLGTSFTASYSDDCVNFTSMSTRNISDALNIQDVGVYVLSSGGDVLSLGRFDYFKLLKTVAINPTLSLGSVEIKDDWSFYNALSLNQSEIISQLLLSNSNTGELYSEQNPIDLSPNIIGINQRGEYDFILDSNRAEKSIYYFKLSRIGGADLDEYNRYAKLTVGNNLVQNSYRWYSNINSLDLTNPIALENQSAYSDSKLNPLRLRLNIKNNLAELKGNTKSFILQYSQNLSGPWNNVGDNKEWEFYDNSSIDTNSEISTLLLSSSTKKENYTEQNPVSNNINNLLDNEVGEYDFSIIPRNVQSNNYYFRLIDSEGGSLDDYINYPQITINSSPYYTLSSYKFFKNTNSTDVGNAISSQNSVSSIESNSEFRLRLLIGVTKNNLLQNEGLFKLQFAEKGTGTCSNPQYAYEPITKTSLIALKDNTSADDDTGLTSNISDPYEYGSVIKNQTYNETWDFSNSISNINIGEYGKWDFALFDNDAGSGKTFCFKVVNVDGSNLNSYINYPEVSIVSGVLSVDIVDNEGNSISNPIFNLDSKIFSYFNSSSQGIFGFNNQKIRIYNTTSNPLWSVTLSPTYGENSYWTNGLDNYDFNDPTENAEDGFDPDSFGGQMSIDPSFGAITPASGGNINGINLGSPSSFIEGLQNSITLVSSSSSTSTNTYWDIMGISILQSIPAQQKTGNYAINMTLTIIGN